MQVDRIKGNKIYCIILSGGLLNNNKGINRAGGALSADSLTLKDKEDLKTAVALEVDYILISFRKQAQDIELANALLYGKDAVMLSYEVDNGQFPLETVKAVHRICVEAEKEYEITNVSQKRSEPHQ